MTKKRLVASRDKIKAIALKNYFGHVKNLPYSKNGFILSQSSLKLNKIQDVPSHLTTSSY